MMWFLQTRSRWRKMQENWSTYICSILTCCKPSHNLVSMAHKNEKLILIFSQMVAAMIWASVWPMWILSKIKISCFHVAKISKNWTLKKSGKSQKIFTTGDPWEPWSTLAIPYQNEDPHSYLFFAKCSLFGSSGSNINPYFTEITDYVVLSCHVFLLHCSHSQWAYPMPTVIRPSIIPPSSIRQLFLIQ